MATGLTRIRGGHGSLGRRMAMFYALLLVLNAGAWGWTALIAHGHPSLLGIALLAYGFGLRHAVDADHIAAIDNVTRKLMQAGQRPAGVGFFFALGHSSVVVVAALLVAVTATAISTRFDWMHTVGGTIGTLVSAGFLMVIALINLAALRGVWRGRHGPCPGVGLPLPGGPMTRLLRPLLRLVTRSWHMAPLGILFGLGFDTATEIALLGISASQAAQGMSIWFIMVFPALFAAGMALVDTTDGVLMLRAYDWALRRPARRLYYNLTITALSVLVAVLIGGIEALGLLGDRFALQGRFWQLIGMLNDRLNLLGFIVIGLFAAVWIGAMLVGRRQKAEFQGSALDPLGP